MASSPPAGNYTTDTDVLFAAANYVTQVGQDMTGAVDSMIAQLGDLPSGWAGSAAQAFYGPGGAQEQWQLKHRELMDACQAIADKLRSSATGYHTTDLDNTTTVRNATPA